MSVWAWLKLTVCLWLLRKIIKAGGWLLLAAIAVAAWPVTVVALAGYAAAWLRGWPPARLRRTAAWALLPAGTWLAIRAARLHGWRPVALTPVQEWERGWSHLAAVEPGPRVPAAGPVRGPGRARAGRAGVGVADLRHHHRPGRHHGLRADHLRCPPVETPGPHRPGPDRRARRGAAAGPGRADPGRRHHPRHRPPLAPRLHHPRRRVRPAHGDRGRDRVAGRRT